MRGLKSAIALLSLLLPVACAVPGEAAATAERSPAVEPAWYEPEIRAYEAADAADPPGKGRVLFIGSSSVRMWSTLADDMAPIPVLNRGFGGSRTPEVLAVMDRIVYPYEPSAIVYYCGDNDLGETNTDSEGAARGFIDFAERVHRRWPGTPILYMSIKPSIARWKNWAAMDRANGIVKAYAESTGAVEFMDLGTCLLGADGAPMKALFREDGLHLNEAGYSRWAPIVRARVTRALEGG